MIEVECNNGNVSHLSPFFAVSTGAPAKYSASKLWLTHADKQGLINSEGVPDVSVDADAYMFTALILVNPTMEELEAMQNAVIIRIDDAGDTGIQGFKNEDGDPIYMVISPYAFDVIIKSRAESVAESVMNANNAGYYGSNSDDAKTKSLKDAVTYKLKERTRITSCSDSVNSRWNDGPDNYLKLYKCTGKDPISDGTLPIFAIKEGKVLDLTEVCMGCKHVDKLATGLCKSLTDRCDRKLFTKNDEVIHEIVLPAESLYIKLGEMRSTEAFVPYTLMDIDLDLNASTFTYVHTASKSQQRATMTRSLRKSLCKHCVISEVCDTKRCYGIYNGNINCSGPLLRSELIDMPSEYLLFHHSVDINLAWSEFKPLIDAYDLDVPSWSKKPILMVGRCLDLDPLSGDQSRRNIVVYNDEGTHEFNHWLISMDDLRDIDPEQLTRLTIMAGNHFARPSTALLDQLLATLIKSGNGNRGFVNTMMHGTNPYDIVGADCYTSGTWRFSIRSKTRNDHSVMSNNRRGYGCTSKALYKTWNITYPEDLLNFFDAGCGNIGATFSGTLNGFDGDQQERLNKINRILIKLTKARKYKEARTFANEVFSQQKNQYNRLINPAPAFCGWGALDPICETYV